MTEGGAFNIHRAFLRVVHLIFTGHVMSCEYQMLHLSMP